MFDIGTKELIIIAIVLVLLFGSMAIPRFARSLAQTIRHIRAAFNDKSDTNEKK